MSLARRHDALLIDLDGVVYRGDQAVPAAAATLAEVRRQGVRVLFLTNNSARTPGEVAAKLEGLGIEARGDDVLTSAVATASLLRRDGGSGRSAFVIGERGIREALEQVGVRLVNGEPDTCDLVVVGWDRSADYAKLRTASLMVERGARLIATNDDAAYPAPDGLWPGAGALLAAVTTTTGAQPLVVGKPARPMFEAAAEITGCRNPLVVGDRLETDIGGAAAMGWDSLLVLSGAARAADLLRAHDLPTYVGADLSAVLDDPPQARFRRATAGDVEGLRALLEASGLRADGTDQRIEQTVVAEDPSGSGAMLATACLEGMDEGDPSNVDGILRSVAVLPEMRGKSLGTLATAAAIRTAGPRHVTRVWLLTETAEGFFSGLGFRRVGREELPAPVAERADAAGDCASATAMRIELAG